MVRGCGAGRRGRRGRQGEGRLAARRPGWARTSPRPPPAARPPGGVTLPAEPFSRPIVIVSVTVRPSLDAQARRGRVEREVGRRCRGRRAEREIVDRDRLADIGVLPGDDLEPVDRGGRSRPRRAASRPRHPGRDEQSPLRAPPVGIEGAQRHEGADIGGGVAGKAAARVSEVADVDGDARAWTRRTSPSSSPRRTRRQHRWRCRRRSIPSGPADRRAPRERPGGSRRRHHRVAGRRRRRCPSRRRPRTGSSGPSPARTARSRSSCPSRAEPANPTVRIAAASSAPRPATRCASRLDMARKYQGLQRRRAAGGTVWRKPPACSGLPRVSTTRESSSYRCTDGSLPTSVPLLH